MPGTGVVRNRVTDPYSATLTADSRRSVVVDLAAETGGNCELTQPGERVVAHDVVVVGPLIGDLVDRHGQRRVATIDRT